MAIAPLTADQSAATIADLAGDQEALGDLLMQHQQVAYNLAYRLLGREADARDAVQEGFLLAVRAIRGDGAAPRDMDRFRSWLLRIVSNAALRQFRHHLPAPPVSVAEIAEVLPGPERVEPAREAERREARADILRALLTLPDAQRMALTLREYLGLSYAEIAAMLDVDRAAVPHLLFRARRAFRAAYAGLTAEPRPVGCPDLAPLLSAMVDNELDGEAWQELSAHRRKCPRCRQELKALRRTRRLHALIPLVAMPPAGDSVAAAAGAASVATVAVIAPAAPLAVGGGLTAKLASLAGAKVAGAVVAAGLSVAAMTTPVPQDNRADLSPAVSSEVATPASVILDGESASRSTAAPPRQPIEAPPVEASAARPRAAVPPTIGALAPASTPSISPPVADAAPPVTVAARPSTAAEATPAVTSVTLVPADIAERAGQSDETLATNPAETEVPTAAANRTEVPATAANPAETEVPAIAESEPVESANSQPDVSARSGSRDDEPVGRPEARSAPAPGLPERSESGRREPEDRPARPPGAEATNRAAPPPPAAPSRRKVAVTQSPRPAAPAPAAAAPRPSIVARAVERPRQAMPPASAAAPARHQPVVAASIAERAATVSDQAGRPFQARPSHDAGAPGRGQGPQPVPVARSMLVEASPRAKDDGGSAPPVPPWPLVADVPGSRSLAPPGNGTPGQPDTLPPAGPWPLVTDVPGSRSSGPPGDGTPGKRDTADAKEKAAQTPPKEPPKPATGKASKEAPKPATEQKASKESPKPAPEQRASKEPSKPATEQKAPKQPPKPAPEKQKASDRKS